jgi:hypothetical protein
VPLSGLDHNTSPAALFALAVVLYKGPRRPTYLPYTRRSLCTCYSASLTPILAALIEPLSLSDHRPFQPSNAAHNSVKAAVRSCHPKQTCLRQDHLGRSRCSRGRKTNSSQVHVSMPVYSYSPPRRCTPLTFCAQVCPRIPQSSTPSQTRHFLNEACKGSPRSHL